MTKSYVLKDCRSPKSRCPSPQTVHKVPDNRIGLCHNLLGFSRPVITSFCDLARGKGVSSGGLVSPLLDIADAIAAPKVSWVPPCGATPGRVSPSWIAKGRGCVQPLLSRTSDNFRKPF